MLSFIITGMIFGNMIFVYMGLLPVVYIFISLLLEEPRIVQVVNNVNYSNAWVDDIIEVQRKIHIDSGFGYVSIGEDLPPFFELIEGSNFKIIWKGYSDYNDTYTYKIRCTKRGVYFLETCNWEKNHALNLKTATLGDTPIDQTLIVKPYPFNIKRIRQQKVLSNMTMPSEARIRMGVPTTEFREIRDYNFGDSYRHINWKATARRALQNQPPKINEYEMEGMKVVWIYLNSASRMALGTTIRNGFEYAVQAVLGLSNFYLSRNCRVGVSFYNDEKMITSSERGATRITTDRLGSMFVMPDIRSTSAPQTIEALEPIMKTTEDLIIPDTGKRQLFTINDRLLNIDILESRYNLQQCVMKSRGHIVGTNPLFIIVTMIDERRYQSLLDGLAEMQKYIKRSRTGRPSVLIIHVSGFGVAARSNNEEFAAQLLEMQEKAILKTLGSYGAMVVHWNPTKQSFEEILLSQVARR
jgi:uncharacterized protein (DUF58 family)